jgi:hypothetical protein
MRKSTSVFAIAFWVAIALLAVVTEANAGCMDGAERSCTIKPNKDGIPGIPGTSVCISGRWSPCGMPLIEEDPQPTPQPTAQPSPVAADIHVETELPVSGVLPPKPSYSEFRIQPDGTLLGVVRGPLAGVPDRMWNPGQTLSVRMTGGSAKVRSKVRQYAVEWEGYANIHFAFVDDSQPADIKISFDKGGSWSTVGRDALAVPFNFSTMNFGWFDDNTSENEFSRVVLHEFGHALGLIHEHQSPVSGIQWDKEKAYKWYKENQGWDKNMVDSQVFEKYRINSTNYSQFDPTSIMEYWVPVELTLDGHGVPGNTTLSSLDKEYIRRWYPHPGDATGQLRTGDDCDEIDFKVEHGVVSPDSVIFQLDSGSNVDWWKSIKVPVGGAEYSEIQIEKGSSSELSISRSDMDDSRPIRFSKAKFLYVHTGLGYSWDVMPALPGGTRVTLTWTKDRCG